MSKKMLIVLSLILLLFLFTACSSPDGNNESAQNDTDTSVNENADDTVNNDTAATEENGDAEGNNTGTGQGQTDANSEWLTFSNEEHQFTVDYPANWIIVDPGENYGVVLRPNEETQTTFYVDTHQSIFEDLTIDDYIDEMMGDLMRIREDTATFGDPEATEINGYPFTALEYQEDGSDGETYYYKDYFTANGYGYIVYYVIPGNEYQELAPTMEKIAASFKFTK